MKQNLLFIFADQLQAFTLGCMGHPVVRTPNIDQLASDGVIFNQTYSNSPVCTPFRGILMSGRYPTQTGCRTNNSGLPADTRCLAHSLNDGGYTTSYVGKWHLYNNGNNPVAPEERCGFTHFAGYQCYNDFVKDVIFYDENEQPVTFEAHRTDATAQLAIERLEPLCSGDRPWAHFVSFQNPHYPIQPSPQYEAMYADQPVEFRPNVQPCEPFTPTYSPYSPRPMQNDPNYQKYGNNIEMFHRLYYALITQLDDAVGRIIQHLKALGQYDNTVIVFTSDHGEMAGAHGRMNKAVAYEESSRIPLIVRTPSGLRDHRRDELIGGIDFNPTLLDWLGLEPEPSFEGRSFAGLTEETAKESQPRTIVAEFGDWIMARRQQWKLVLDRDSREPMHLFNLEADPYELTDLVDSDEADAVEARTQLGGHLAQWAAHVKLDESE